MERDFANDPYADPNYYDPYSPAPTQTPFYQQPGWYDQQPQASDWVPNSAAPPPTGGTGYPDDNGFPTDPNNKPADTPTHTWVWINNRWQQEWKGQQPGGGTGAPTNGAGIGGGGGLGGGVFDGVGGPPQMLPYPSYQSPGQFEFDPYKASSWQDAENEPGYAASRKQLRQQIEAGAAHRGVLRSGMTVGDLYSNLDALGQQNFKQFDDRNFRNWSGNRDLAATKYGFRAQDIDRSNNYNYNVADSSFKDALSRWQTMVGSLTSLARPVE